jgi:hypothetical protein
MEKPNPSNVNQERESSRETLEIAEEARQKISLPSFSSNMFNGAFSFDLLYPFPEQNSEDERIGSAYVQKISKFLQDNLDPDEVDRKREIPEVVIKGLIDMGAFALKIPKEYGGLGFSQTNYTRIIMNVASYCGSTAVLLSAHQSIGVPQPLKMFGTEEQKKRYFPKLRSGWISAFALTEVQAGSDPAQIEAEAKISEDGSHYILNGTKLWCTNGTIANVIVVMALTAPKLVKGKEKKQISAFILEMDSPGVKVVHRSEFMGLGGIYNGVIRFENVKIPKENLLDKEGRGLAIALATINSGRLTLAAASVAAAKQCLMICRKWGNERVQWGKPVGYHETGREKIAYIAATTFAMEAVATICAHWQDQGTMDVRAEAAMAKLFCSETLWTIADLTVQFRGGRGYETAASLKQRGEIPYPVERILRDCRINRIIEGSTEIMKLFLAREAIDPHLKKIGNILTKTPSFIEIVKLTSRLSGHYLLWISKQWFQSNFGSERIPKSELSDHLLFVKRKSHKLANKIFFSMVRYQQGLEKKQRILNRLMDIATDLFAMSAACSYALSLVKKKPEDHSPIQLADYFCLMARRRIQENFNGLSDNDDRKGNELAKQVLEGKLRWLEEGVIKFDHNNT